MGDFSTEKLFLFGLFALPGAVAIRVYSLWCPAPTKDWKESIFDAVIYSSAGLVLWAILIPSVVKAFVEGVLPKEQEAGVATAHAVNAVFDNRLGLLLYLFVTPTALTTLWYFARLWFFHEHLGFDHPIRTAWDWVFSRRQSLYIFFQLKNRGKDGERVVKVGYFNGSSYVTTYPYDAEIYVERMHVLNPDGTVGPAIPGSNGMLIRLSECEWLEFLKDPTLVALSVRERVWNRAKGMPRTVRDGCSRAARKAHERFGPHVTKGIAWLRNQGRAGRGAPPPTTGGPANP